MTQLRFPIFCCVLGLVCWGCAAASSPPPSPPALQLKTFYYIGAMGVHLKGQPDAASPDTGTVKLNEKVQSLKRQGSWFQVRTASGQEGWANERDLKLNPVSDFYVRRWGVRLRQAPQGRAKTVERLRPNDQVKLLDQNDQGWARVTNARSQKTGWLEMSDLATDRVVVHRRYRSKSGKKGTASPASGPAPAETQPEPASPPPGGILTPAPAQAAPPPAKAPAVRKQRPELFEPF